jgi:N-acetylglucosaminyl-diphospho-decaprenol L-rhamnosyltransferase
MLQCAQGGRECVRVLSTARPVQEGMESDAIRKEPGSLTQPAVRGSGAVGVTDADVAMSSWNTAQSSAPQAEYLDLLIVILNYNTAALLRGCLQSLRTAAPGLHHRIVVVDNASTDGSAAMVRTEFPEVELIASPANIGYSAGNNLAFRVYGLDRLQSEQALPSVAVPAYALLLNPDTLVPPGTLEAMVRFMAARPEVGAAGPRVRRPDGTLDLACRRSFPTPQVSFYRMVGLSRLFPRSRRFNAYNLEFLPEDAVHAVDAVVGAFMLLRREAVLQVGLLDEGFFMYGEDLDWAKRIKDAGWEVWYNGQVEITHVKAAASRQSPKSRIDFYEAMWLFYRKHYRAETPRWLDLLIQAGIVVKGAIDVARHLWAYCREPRPAAQSTPVP